MQDGSPTEKRTPPLSPNPTNWKFYTSTHHTWDEMIAAINRAEHTIDFEQFKFSADNISRRFIEALIERAKHGVRVRLLVDAMGAVTLGQSLFLEAMEHVGIETRFFNWIRPFSKGKKRTWYFRDHRRMLLIDKKILFTGGICISDEMRDWRDTTVELSGDIIDQVQLPFERMWYRASKRSIRMDKRPLINLSGFAFYTQAPLPRQRFLYFKLIEALRKAQHYAYLTTPYFLPDNRLFRAILKAKRRGVDVRVLVPTISDHTLVDRGSHTYFNKLLDEDIKIFRYRNMIHTKTVVIDGNWTMVGTLNLDNISLRYNFESAVVTTNTHFAAEVAGHFMNDLHDADELTFEQWKNRPFLSKLLELLVWPIRKFL